ncbi:Hypothetical protein P9211_06821 [Prochlorococcus marinus str. MIT 9211]|uniref:Uncharacterized protein n=1 Tax=Prochlorococcus marinus (strain MIT 9211) TaxID=93059 RepID=A9B9V1_PROM4|nr:Hypothetical protein P9211_06821 [Prochlorococcus marinus str. MIT 9211]
MWNPKGRYAHISLCLIRSKNKLTLVLKLTNLKEKIALNGRHHSKDLFLINIVINWVNRFSPDCSGGILACNR